MFGGIPNEAIRMYVKLRGGGGTLETQKGLKGGHLAGLLLSGKSEKWVLQEVLGETGVLSQAAPHLDPFRQIPSKLRESRIPYRLIENRKGESYGYQRGCGVGVL